MTVETTGLPPAIQAQVDQAEALHAQVYAPAPDAGNTEVSHQDAAQATAVAEPPQPVEPAHSPAPQDEGYKSKFEVLQGKYNAEVPRLHHANRELQQQLQQVALQLDEIRRKPETKPEPLEKLVTEKDVETFGEDMIDVVRRLFHQEMRSVLPEIFSQLRNEFQPKLAQVEQVAQRQIESDSDRYWDAVTRAVPAWNSIDSDPRWIDFLNSKAPGSLRTYRELAGDAIAAQEVQPIVELVGLWEAKTGIAQQPARKADAQAELQRQVAPNTVKAHAAPVGDKTWTRAEYEHAYDPRRMADTKPDQLAALQAEADRAVAENRVRW